MIINTGCRTDIPAFYSKWFLNRIKEGYVLVRNPYYQEVVIKYELNPRVVDYLEFCTKNPKPLLEHLDELKKYKQFWSVTITPYNKEIEIKVPNKQEVIQSFQRLSQKLGSKFMTWRYDPIFFYKEYTFERHIQEFSLNAKSLKGYTHICVISFLDLYSKVKKNAPNYKVPTIKEQLELSKELVKIASANDMVIYACCENSILETVGVKCIGCRNQTLIEKTLGYKLNIPKVPNLRGSCSCVLGNDIGAYNTCLHFCRYCYANESATAVLKNIKNHDDNSPLLIGNITSNDKIVSAHQKSFKISEKQLQLF